MNLRLPRLRRFKVRELLTLKNLALASSAGLIVMGLFFLWAASLELPDLKNVQERKVAQSTKIYDRTGEVLLYDLSQNITRTVVPIEQMSRYIREATVAIEDAEFYEHKGVKPTAFARAMLVNLRSLSFSQGGSTITQQVIKNALLTQDKTPARKLKEWVLAVKLERVLPKEKILELYLNENPYGGSIYGVQEAAQAFFGKPATDVTLAEAAYLAALPQAPSYYSPYGNHREQLDARKNTVLSRMREQGRITQAEYDAAKAEVVEFKPQRVRGITAPHFVFYVQEQLEEKYGSRMLEGGGLKVITSLDAKLQEKAEEIVKRNALENAADYNAKNAALVAIDPRNGEVLVMVGSRDYFDKEIPGNYNIAVASRQPGSSFKPFVYAAAFGKGYTPETVVFDLRTQFSTACGAGDITKTEPPCYSPQNYDNKFRGPVTLREALAQSLNIPAVKTLYLVGIGDAVRLAKSMGVTTLTDPNRYGLTLVLGGGEVRLLDMVSAYGGFATNGYHNEPLAILRIEDASGKIIEENRPSGSSVLSQDVASQINDILSDNAARAPAFGSNSALYFPDRDVAVKTGTTNDYKDAWIVGYTPNLVVGAWAGNNDNTSMEKRVAGFIIAPLWHEFMNVALAERPVERFVRLERDLTGLPPVLRGIWQGGIASGGGVEGGVHSILYWIDKDNPTGGRPANPASDPQFSHWEIPVRAWATGAGIGDGPVTIPGTTPPSSTTPSPAGTFAIASPSPGALVESNAPLALSVAGPSVTRVDYYINGAFLGASTQAPFSLTIIPQSLNGILSSGNKVRAVGTLEGAGQVTAETTFDLR